MPPTDVVPPSDVVIGISGIEGTGALETGIDAARSGIATYLDTDADAAGRRRERAGRRSAQARRRRSRPARARHRGRLRRRLAGPASPALPRLAGPGSCAARVAGGRARLGRQGLRGDRREPPPRRDAGTCALAGPADSRQPDGLRDAALRRVTRAEGAITKSILSPMFRTVFGCPIRQPAARDFGCSAGALRHLLAQRVWDEVGRDESVDIWITTEAAIAGLRIGEAEFGPAQHAADAVDAQYRAGVGRGLAVRGGRASSRPLAAPEELRSPSVKSDHRRLPKVRSPSSMCSG